MGRGRLDLQSLEGFMGEKFICIARRSAQTANTALLAGKNGVKEEREEWRVEGGMCAQVLVRNNGLLTH